METKNRKIFIKKETQDHLYPSNIHKYLNIIRFDILVTRSVS
jgi:hypothetical protein